MSFVVPDISIDSYIFTFGKYKGLYLSDIVEDNPEYVLWCLENIEWFKLSPSDEDKVYSEAIRLANIGIERTLHREFNVQDWF